MSELLEYIIKVPSEEDSHDRAHKLPFMISDILAQENNSLLEVFFNEEEEECTSDKEGSDEEYKDAVDTERALD